MLGFAIWRASLLDKGFGFVIWPASLGHILDTMIAKTSCVDLQVIRTKWIPII